MTELRYSPNVILQCRVRRFFECVAMRLTSSVMRCEGCECDCSFRVFSLDGGMQCEPHMLGGK